MTVRVVNMRNALAIAGIFLMLIPVVTKAQRAVSGIGGVGTPQVTSGTSFEAFRQTPRTPLTEEQALETPVDPETYILGSGDLIGISIMGGIDQVFEARVSPEGNLMIPMLPILHIGGMTLATAADSVNNQWGNRFPETTIKISLIEIRLFRVTVAGAIVQPGTYFLTPVDRVSMLVEMAGGILNDVYWRDYYAPELQKPFEDIESLKKKYKIPFSSERFATLYRQDGSELPVDLLRFEREADEEANPLLKDGDRLVVAFKSENAPFVAISGGVAIPGRYEWKNNDRLNDLIRLAGGLLPDVDSSNVQLTRFSENTIAESFELDITEESGSNFELQPADLVLIRRKAGRQRMISVEVRGEANFPGVYPVIEGKTTLNEIIDQAGGLSNHAFIKGIQVWRQRESENLISVGDRLKKSDPMSWETIDRQFYRLNYRWQEYDRLGGEPGAIFKEGRKSLNPLLHDGDVVFVPNHVESVILIGQVINPGVYPYKEGWVLKDYINAAGGYSKNARKGLMRVLPYEVSSWQKPGRYTVINPGDMIFIPEAPHLMRWIMFQDYLMVVSQAATVIAVIVSLR
ncbi:MAG: SLBB domain-containing protein [Candidatus Electryonea clarkiae]|nr:SLBB domain-containing protein [Candidatus Electryonea clarkiae]MDP8288688.1 SLBB domain-containing protein [Candidatus Electryonea clarkiae]